MQAINGFQLSPQQRWVWLLQQNSPAYRAQCAISIEGNLQLQVLKEALHKVADRQEILRTSFHRTPGIKLPIQVIAERATPAWEWVNLQDCTPEEQEAKIWDIFQEEKRQNFQLDSAPLWRLSLISLSADRHILTIGLPSLCADTATLNNLVREISEAYASCIQNEELSADEVVQYVQFSEWQNQLLEDEDAEAGKEYWQERDFSALAALKLPFENQQAGVPAGAEFHSLQWEIAPAIAAQIDAIAREREISVPVFLLSCWKTLLWRLAGQADIIVATAFDGRKYEELQPALGLFAKFLPLHSHLEDSFRFSEILQHVQESEREAYKWQEYFCREDIGEPAGFPFGFEFEGQPAKHSAAGVSFSLCKQYVCFERFKVKLSCRLQEDSLVTEFHWDAGVIGAEAIQCLAEQFHALVASAARHPESPISQLQILSERARNQLVVEFNKTQQYFPKDRLAYQLFESHAELTPDSIAAVFENQQLTYRSLNERANQLAHYLQQLGVKPEVTVGICAERSLEAIVGILGILKAGGAYLPLEAAMPAERLGMMLRDAGVPVLLTQQHLAGNFAETVERVVCLDTDWDEIALQSNQNFPSEASGENLAYVIYTSGSTGIPKGVAVEHRQLLNYLHAIQQILDAPAASFATVSTFAADLGHTAIFPALCGGGCLHIISQERATDPEALAEYFRRHTIDCLKIVPSHLKALLTDSKPAQVLPRRRLILGGEALSWNLIETVRKYAPDCQIFNHYGPTETAVGALTYQVRERAGYASETVPLGRPLANAQVYVLDSQLQPVPVGAAGELHIGGAGVARGYLNQPELTAEKFIANPFADFRLPILDCRLGDAGEESKNVESNPPLNNPKSKIQNPKSDRLYKTGDLARYLPDGTIEFLGRIDRQVKLRGFRIELGEIEAVLSQHPAVRQAAVLLQEVLLQEKEPANQRLVAYVVPARESAAAINELRSFLSEKLPEYMVPSAFVALEAMPLTPNGKIDRRALPAPENVERRRENTFVAPRTPVEEILAGIWAELLGLEKVGVYDNFFDLGGHSLLLTQLLAKVRDAFQVQLPLRRLFEAPTAAGLAQIVEMERGAEASVAPASNLDLNAEAVLAPDIRPATVPAAPAEATRILLTGATGFLGAFLLHELLQQTPADIYCLVRCSDAESGKKRIQESLKAYAIWDERLSHRIVPVAGDLSQPLLGLSDEQFRAMASQVDAIYHNGAFVKFTYPYSVLKAPNVLGTQEILRLASQTKVKPVHFISTISVFSPAGHSGMRLVREGDELTPGEALSGAYPQTKWVAEKLVAAARERGVPVCIYRPGRISGHSQTGACNPSDLLCRLIAGCIQLGCAPDLDKLVNIAPVDYVSKAIVHLSKQKESLGKNFHLVNPQSLYLNELVSWIRSAGYPLNSLSYERWQAEVVHRAGDSPENPLYPLAGLFYEGVSQGQIPQAAALRFDCQNTLDGLAGTDIACPPADARLLRTYLSYMIECGSVSAPLPTPSLPVGSK